MQLYVIFRQLTLQLTIKNVYLQAINKILLFHTFFSTLVRCK